ncbi:MAG: hypothetical protein NTW19_22715 [Planctomycetota bacterium]|nr:hypothetical protein [Planctomycetota bacterium]
MKPTLRLASRLAPLLALLALASPAPAPGADLPKPEPTPGRLMLPQEHQYERVLRKYLASLTEKDFTHGVAGYLTETPLSPDLDVQHRNFVLTLMNQPIIGSKRGYPCINAPGHCFTLNDIETAGGIMDPPVWPETLTTFVQWNYPGNPFYDNRALKLRALATGIVKMIMIDDWLDRNPNKGRSDWYSYEMVILGAPFRAFKDVMPADARAAYAEGLKKYARRVIAWGPTRNEPNFDLTMPIGLWYVIKGCDDPEFTKEAEAHAKLLFTDPKYFHPAGFWVERGGLDMGYSGMGNCFAVGAALTGDWPWAKEAVERVYRLKSHLTLPEPDGRYTGPTHFNCRLGTPSDNDQWMWTPDNNKRHGARDYGAAELTDEAAWLVDGPTAEDLKTGALLRVEGFNHGIVENPVKSGTGSKEDPRIWYKNEELHGYQWERRMWQTWDFPLSVNFAYEFYPKGYDAHRRDLEAKKSPMLKSPYLRDGSFLRDFEKAFYATKQASFAAILQTGPIGQQTPDDKLAQFCGPLGLGGGQLSAFWTPATGSVILGRRSGNKWDNTFDLVDAWRTWPNHSVNGVTPEGKFFTSARIVKPEVVSEVAGNKATVKVSGALTSVKFVNDPEAALVGKTKMLWYDDALPGKIDFTREFKLDETGVHVETTVSGDGKETAAELYDVIPVFHRDAAIQKEDLVTKIEFQAGGNWAPATEAYVEKVKAVRLTRAGGSVLVTFDSPRRVKLSPTEWKDTYLSGAICRNVMIDLLETGDKPAAVKDAKKVGYRIEAGK